MCVCLQTFLFVKLSLVAFSHTDKYIREKAIDINVLIHHKCIAFFYVRTLDAMKCTHTYAQYTISPHFFHSLKRIPCFLSHVHSILELEL